MLSLAAPVLAQPVTYLTNRFLSEGVFPNIFKTSKVLTTFKSGHADAVQNYRPISRLPSLGKVIEKFFSPDFSTIWTLTINFAKSKRVFVDTRNMIYSYKIGVVWS